MNFELERPEAVIKAQEKQKGLNWFLEMLVFVPVFFVCMFAQILVTLPGELMIISMNADYQAAAAAGDLEGMAEALRLLAGSDLYMVLALFSTVAMTAVTLLFCRLVQKRRPDTLGFVKRGAGREYLIGLAAGFVAFSAAVLLCVLTGDQDRRAFRDLRRRYLCAFHGWLYGTGDGRRSAVPRLSHGICRPALSDVGGSLFQRGYLRGAASVESWDQRAGVY